jgi:hypothetical protein
MERALAEMAASPAAVLISASVPPDTARGRLGLLKIPLVIWQPALFGDLGLTGPSRGADYGPAGAMSELALVDIAHPLAAGLSGRVRIASQPTRATWALPAPAALWVATPADDINHAAILAYEKESLMARLPAPARRVGLGFVDIDTPLHLTREGWALFNAAVAWAAERGESHTTGGLDSGNAADSPAVSTGAPVAVPDGKVPAGTGALLIVGSTTLTAGDTAIKTRLVGLGFTVTVKTSAGYRSTDLTGKSVVVIAATAIPTEVNTQFLTTTIGVVFMRPQLFSGNGLTGSVTNTDWGTTTSGTQLTVTGAANDPMIAGLSGTVAVVTTGGLGWGVPNANGATLAVVPSTTHAASFRYVPGATMVGGPAASGRRVGLFPSDAAAAHLTGPGGSLVDAAFVWAAGFSNAPPQVIPGADHSALIAPATTPVDMTVVDDGVPGPTTVTWSVVSCPGVVTFGDLHAAHTTALFQPAAAGSACTLRLTASDGALSSSADLHIQVYSQNQPPMVNAGPDQSLDLGAATQVTLSGSVTDDGLPYPPAAITTLWSQVGGPGIATFADPTARSTTAQFSAPGVYTLRLTASDTALTAADDMLVTVTSTVLLVVGDPLQSGDSVMQSRLQALGYNVATKISDGSLATADANGKTLVVISASALPGWVAAKFKATGVPVIVLLAGVWQNMQLTSAAGVTGNGAETQVTITNNGAVTSFHPITAGRRGTIAVGATAGDFVYGLPASTKSRVARLIDDTTNFVVFAYDKGDVMNQFTAPGRRVAMGFRNETMSSLTADGAALFDAAVNWSTKTNRVPVVNAGPDQVVTSPAAATLVGSASDDGMPNGTLSFNWSQVGGPGTVAFGNATAATTTATFSVPGVYLLRLTASDGAASGNDDVTVVSNAAPVVSAGPDLTAKISLPISLQGSASDTTIPNPPGALSATWTKISGPGSVAFSNPNALTPTATFTLDGQYVLRLVVTDGYLSASDDTTVLVSNDPPIVDAGADIVLRMPNAAALHGSVIDTTIPVPPGVLTSSWSLVSGPGTVTFADASRPDTTATFSLEGRYVLRLTGSDSLLSASDDVVVTVQVEGNPTALVVVGSGSHPGDAAIQGRLQQLGYSVLVKGDAAVAASDATNRDVVFITGTVNPPSLGTKLRSVSAPVLTAQPLAFDLIGLTGAHDTDRGVAVAQTALHILDPSHPLAAGLAGTPTIFSVPQDIGWGAPGSQAALVGSTEDGSHVVLFAFEAGTPMPSGIRAPGRRVGLFTFGDSPSALTEDGWKLVDAAIHWTRYKVAAPAFSPLPGTYSSVPQHVSLTCSTVGAAVRYTTDGSDPRVSATALSYAGPFDVNTTTTVKAAGLKTGWDSSDVVSAIYVISFGVLSQPTITPPSGELTGIQVSVSIAAQAGSTIHYTTDGGVPTEASPTYVSAFVLTSATTVRARAFRTDWTPSTVAVSRIGFDPDHDGLSNTQEAQLGTDPTNPDTNGDGIDDGSAVALGISPTSMDMDGDGVTNPAEIAQGTNPFNPDTDGDGTPDGADCFPLDPSQQCPSGQTGDTTPPSITLTEPPGARLISSTP